LGTIITVADRTICSLRRMVILRTVTATVRMDILTTITIMDRVRMVIRRMVIRRMVIRRMVILRTVTATVRMDILTTITIMDRVRMVIRTIGNQSIETKPTRPSTDGARPLFSHSIEALKTQAVSSRAA